MSDHDDEKDHHHPQPLSESALRAKAIEALLVEKGLLASDAIDKIVATYDYRDEQSRLVFQVVRFDPKNFRQRKPDGNGDWTWSVKDVRRVPYRLPELLKADAGGIVFIAEGERDCDRGSSAWS